jgi:hypothetical protein
LYIGEKRVFAALLVLGNFLSFAGLGYIIGGSPPPIGIFFLYSSGHNLIGFAFAYDAYKLAKDTPPVA